MTGTSEPATGEPTTGEGPVDAVPLEACMKSFADEQIVYDAQCQCLVDGHIFDNPSYCSQDGPFLVPPTDAAAASCLCEVYSQSPDTKARFDCLAAARAMALICMGRPPCDDPSFAANCSLQYISAVAACEPPPREASGQVALQCDMIPPHLCDSGETIPETWQCDFAVDCADASDEVGCPGSFVCADGLQYVPESSRCDDYPNCSDASDEAGCPVFMCKLGKTLLKSQVCNGAFNCCPVGTYPDCDLSDEQGCTPFECKDGSGDIASSFLCNGFRDCGDLSDEVDCVTFNCSSGDTVPFELRCDGKSDCLNGSDEAGCA